MLQKIEIKGCSFIQADINGCYLPSATSIEFLMGKIRDKRNKKNFCDRANETTLVLANKYYLPIHLLEGDIYRAWHKNLDWADISYDDVNKVLTKNIALWCDLNKYSFSKVIQSLFVINWFGDLRDNVHLNWGKYQTSLHYCFNNFFSNANELTEPEYTFSKPSTVDSPEYMASKTFYLEFLSRSEPISMEYLYQSFISQIEEMSPTTFWQIFIPQIKTTLDYNRKVKGLMVLTLRAMRKEAEFDKSLQRLCLCEKCRQKYFIKQKASTSDFCDSCQKQRKDEKKANRRIDRKGWQYSHKGLCKGACESLSEKRLNDDDICDWCFLGWDYSHVGTCKNCECPNKEINTLSSCLNCFRSSL